MDITARELLRAVTAGFASGFIVSIPVGPVNLTVINQALRRGFLHAFLVGLGAISAETSYAMLAFAGHATLPRGSQWLLVLRIVALVAVTAMGVHNLLLRQEKFEALSTAKAELTDQRWHHPRSFLLGFLLALSNVMLLVIWATFATVLDAHGWADMDVAPMRWTCLAGVVTGAATWFCLVAWIVSHAHRRIAPRTLTWLARGCGAVFIGIAGLLAYKLSGP
jgi:threonine/homoserine/homoserine lactone efflux protein